MPTPEGPYAGRVVIVTGGGQGIGLQTARTFAAAGASIAVFEVNQTAVDTASAEFEAAGTPALVLPIDVTDAAAVQAGVDQVTREFGPVAVLVNNAGVVVLDKFLDHSIEDWRRTMDVNLTAMFVCAKAVVPAMAQRRAGSIVNIASIAGYGFTTPHVAYAVSKAGVVALTRELGVELAPLGIRVNAIAPGPTESPMNSGVPAELKAQLARSIPTGRMGRPVDIARAVYFLASDESEFIVGQTITVSGGAGIRIT